MEAARKKESFVKTGKPLMVRQHAKAPPKKEVKKDVYKPEEQDMIDYDLGDILPLFMARREKE